MSRKEGDGVEEKVRIVRKILKWEISISAASREIGVGRETIRRWMARYEAEGAAGFLSREQNRVYPPELKRQAVEDYLAGSGSLLEISKKYKLRNDRQLHNWIKEYNARGTWRFQLCKIFKGRKLHEARTGNDAGGTYPNSQRMHRQREELRGDGLEVPGKLSADADMDTSF